MWNEDRTECLGKIDADDDDDDDEVENYVHC